MFRAKCQNLLRSDIQYHKGFTPLKTCNMPYISENPLTFLKLNWKILPPQHIVVNPFPDYSVTGKHTCINLNPDIHPKKLRLTIQTLNILRLNDTYFNQIIQNQENVKNDWKDWICLTSVNHQDQTIFRIPQPNRLAIQVTPILIFKVYHTPKQ